MEVYLFTIAYHPASDRKIPQKGVRGARTGKPMKLSKGIANALNRENDLGSRDLRGGNAGQDESSNCLAKSLGNILHLFLAEPRVDGQREDLA